jgi:hypothetical protein
MLKKLDKWHKTTRGRIFFTVVELLISYGFACLAINSGSLWWYLFTVSFFVGAINNFKSLLGKFHHAKK